MSDEEGAVGQDTTACWAPRRARGLPQKQEALSPNADLEAVPRSCNLQGVHEFGIGALPHAEAFISAPTHRRTAWSP